jgi:alkanesulfonate monooxygenase SsuD/methylene tetrahydromethanopterin reductase-like flavin-dependent oxidoreductase (luciferase family)
MLLMAVPFHLIWFTTAAALNWDYPDNASYPWSGPDVYVEMAKVLETRGKFDAVVLADSDGISTAYRGVIDTYVKYGSEMVGKGDPLPIFAAMAGATRQIGLVPTLSTTFFTPQLLAQTVASLDHLSNGRSGWNIVTSIGDYNAQNYGMDRLPEGDARYDRADAVVQEAEALWRQAREAAAGESHSGLYMPSPPQGRPVYMQAGGSERGREFAARYAEITIIHSNSIGAMKRYRDDIRARMIRIGRDPDSCKVFYTAKAIVADSKEEAEALYARHKLRKVLDLEAGLANFSSRIGYDFSKLELDEPVPHDLPIWGSTGQLQQHVEKGRSPTLREIGRIEGIKESYMALGTPEQIADQFAEHMEKIGGDGFAMRETLHPSNVLPVVDRLVPVLRSRGLIRSDYRYPTFRENLMDPDFNKPVKQG